MNDGTAGELEHFCYREAKDSVPEEALKVICSSILPVGEFNAAICKLIGTVPNLVSVPRQAAPGLLNLGHQILGKEIMIKIL